MAVPHFHAGLGHGGPRHVCMMESYDPEVVQSTMRFESLVEENKKYANEVEKLRALLAQNNIPIPTEQTEKTIKPLRKPRRSLRLCNKNGVLGMEEIKPLPDLPTEILLRILGFAVKSPVPIIDPFYKLRKDNITKEERRSRKNININFLATSKAVNIEGKRLIVENNELIFTQAAALERFAKTPEILRANINHVTIRCVGKYYFDKQKKLDLDGDTIYHESVAKFTVPTLARPPGLVNDGGIQAYCWYQVADFLKTFQLPLDRTTKERPKLFPNLTSLRMDLVNFCDHLPLGIWGFASVIRWHLGAICDELTITGIPEMEGGTDEEMLLRNLLRDEGLISTGCPVFISSSHGLKPLDGYGYSQAVVRANKPSLKAKAPTRFTHPDGGLSPKSSHAAGTTIWKWTSDHTNRPRTWIEFDRATGYPMNEIDPPMDTSEEDDDDDDDDEIEWDDEYGEDDYDEDDYDEDDLFMPALMASFGAAIFGPPPVDEDEDEDMPPLLPLDDNVDEDEEMPNLVPLDGNADEDEEMPGIVPLAGLHSDVDSLD